MRVNFALVVAASDRSVDRRHPCDLRSSDDDSAEISIIQVTPSPYAAIVVGRMTPAELVHRWGTNGISSAVYEAQRKGVLPKGGHNIWMYRNQGVNGEADMEVGMQMPAKFDGESGCYLLNMVARFEGIGIRCDG